MIWVVPSLFWTSKRDAHLAANKTNSTLKMLKRTTYISKTISIPNPLICKRKMKLRPKRASFSSKSKVARALRARNFSTEEKRSLKTILKSKKLNLISIPYPLLEEKWTTCFPWNRDRSVRASEVNQKWRVRCAPEIFWPKRKGASSSYWTGTSSTAPSAWGLPAAAVVTVVDFAIIIEYRVSREPCNNILQPTCTFDFWGFLDFRFRYHTQKGKHYEITFLIFHFCTIIWFFLFLFVLHVTTSPISFLCLRTPYLHHVLPTTTAFVSHQSYSSVNHLLQCFCLFVCICLFDFFCKYTPLHITYLPISCLLLHYIPLLHKMLFDFNLELFITFMQK